MVVVLHLVQFPSHDNGVGVFGRPELQFDVVAPPFRSTDDTEILNARYGPPITHRGGPPWSSLGIRRSEGLIGGLCAQPLDQRANHITSIQPDGPTYVLFGSSCNRLIVNTRNTILKKIERQLYRRFAFNRPSLPPCRRKPPCLRRLRCFGIKLLRSPAALNCDCVSISGRTYPKAEPNRALHFRPGPLQRICGAQPQNHSRLLSCRYRNRLCGSTFRWDLRFFGFGLCVHQGSELGRSRTTLASHRPNVDSREAPIPHGVRRRLGDWWLPQSRPDWLSLLTLRILCESRSYNWRAVDCSPRRCMS